MTENAKQLVAQRKIILKRILKTPLWVNGSVIETTKKSRDKETPFYYLSQSIKGKNKITYISAKHLKKFKAAAAEGVNMKMLQSKLSAINVKLIKAGCNDD